MFPNRRPATRVPVRVRHLTDHDRCDRCGARAYAKATVRTGPLYFCGHHFRRYRDALVEHGAEIVDDLDLLAAGN